jgi:hypothetical protein
MTEGTEKQKELTEKLKADEQVQKDRNSEIRAKYKAELDAYTA